MTTEHKPHIDPEADVARRLATAWWWWQRDDSEHGRPEAVMPQHLIDLAAYTDRLEEQLEAAQARERDFYRLADSLDPIFLRQRIARYIRDLEPVVTSTGLANFLSAELLSWVTTRPPFPGEYADPQPVAVDTCRMTTEHKPHKRLWFSPYGTEWEAETYEEALEMERDSLVEQLETLRRHDEAATQDAAFFRKRMVDAEEQLEAAREAISRCDGSCGEAWAALNPASMPCPKCRGQGDVHGDRCHRCGGSGDIPSPAKERP